MLAEFNISKEQGHILGCLLGGGTLLASHLPKAVASRCIVSPNIQTAASSSSVRIRLDFISVDDGPYSH